MKILTRDVTISSHFGNKIIKSKPKNRNSLLHSLHIELDKNSIPTLVLTRRPMSIFNFAGNKKHIFNKENESMFDVMKFKLGMNDNQIDYLLNNNDNIRSIINLKRKDITPW